jgi:hypothetical protein
VLLAGAPAPAHDLWLVPDGAPGPGQVAVRVCTGDSFPISVHRLEPERIVSFNLHSRAGVRPISGAAADGLALVTRVELPADGVIVALSIAPRLLRLEAREFNDYLTHDGVLQILEQRRLLQELARPVTERYSKHAKLLLAGTAGHNDLALRPIGAELEIVPHVDPARLQVGHLLELTVLFHGAPAPGLTILGAGAGAAGSLFSAVTDARGEAAFPPDAAGLWSAHVIHMTRLSGDPAADYESVWATLTFWIGPAPASSTPIR